MPSQTFYLGNAGVKAGLIEFEIIPLRPYPGFARLFADGE